MPILFSEGDPEAFQLLGTLEVVYRCALPEFNSFSPLILRAPAWPVPRRAGGVGGQTVPIKVKVPRRLNVLMSPIYIRTITVYLISIPHYNIHTYIMYRIPGVVERIQFKFKFESTAVYIRYFVYEPRKYEIVKLKYRTQCTRTGSTTVLD